MYLVKATLLLFGLWFVQSSLMDVKLPIYRRVQKLKAVQLLFRECFSQIANAYHNAPNHDNFVMVIPYFSENDVSVRSFTLPAFVINTKSEHIHWLNVRRGDIYYVISNLPIAAILKKIPWTDNTFFTVYVADKTESLLYFRDFWAEGIVNVVALTLHGDFIRLLTFYPFTDKHCGEVSEVVELGLWNSTSGVPDNLYPDKVKDLKNCPLRILLLYRPPAVMISPDTGEVAGGEVEILKSVAKAMNATPIFGFFHDEPWTKTIGDQSTNFLMHALEDKHCDIVAGSLMYTASVRSSSEAIDYVESLCVTFVLPTKTKELTFKYVIVYLILPQNILMVIATVLVTIIVIYEMKLNRTPVSITSSVSLVTSPLIGGVFNPKNSQKTRILLGLWLWTCFVFWKIYEAFVSSSIIAPNPQRQMETLDEVLESDLTIVGESFLISEILFSYAEQKKLPKISRTKWLLDDAILEVSNSTPIAYLGTRSNIRYTASLYPDVLDKVHIVKNCATRYSPVFQTAKFSPYKKELAKWISSLSEFGIIRRLFLSFDEEIVKRVQRYRPDSTIVPLSLVDLSGAFFALATGLLVALLIFIFEHCSKRCQRIRNLMSVDSNNAKYSLNR